MSPLDERHEDPDFDLAEREIDWDFEPADPEPLDPRELDYWLRYEL